DLRQRGNRIRGAHLRLVGDPWLAVSGVGRPWGGVPLACPPRQHLVDQRRAQSAPSAGHHDHLACYGNHLCFLPCWLTTSLVRSNHGWLSNASVSYDGDVAMEFERRLRDRHKWSIGDTCSVSRVLDLLSTKTV